MTIFMWLILVTLGGCVGHRKVHAERVHAAVVIERGCIVSVALGDKTECDGADMEHLHCGPLTLTYKPGCEKLRVQR